MNIGIAGTGRMGSAIAARLIGHGHKVAVWKRTRAKTPARPAFDLDAMRKDLRTLLEEAQGLGVELPTAARVRETFDRAAHAGHDGIDGVRIPAWVSRAGGNWARGAGTYPST